MSNASLHTHTPSLQVVDPRYLPVRAVQFYRTSAEQLAEALVSQNVFDSAGRHVACRDPRLFALSMNDDAVAANLSQRFTLSGISVHCESVDAGWRVGLFGQAQQCLHTWDSRENQRQLEYDPCMRVLSVTEQGRVTERLGYAGPEGADYNQCGRLIRHDDPAGTVHTLDYALSGPVVVECRSFTSGSGLTDWPLEEAARDALLEALAYETRWASNALGEALEQLDALGNTRRFTQTVAGKPKSVSLALAGSDQHATLIEDIRYNALGQVDQETAGNGVVSRYFRDPQDGRMTSLQAGLAGKTPLQQLNYAYDPAGNILEIEDACQPVMFFANQRIEPVNRYCYDTLYQLTEASGREVKTGASHGPALPGLQNLPPDPGQLANYTQSYAYDTAGNLLQMRHVGAQNFTRVMQVDTRSNRSLAEGEADVELAQAFDANGNLLQLVRGQALNWDVRNQLQQITTVSRTDAANDNERYVYDGHGQRCRKLGSTQASNRTLVNEVRYLPGLEVRTRAGGEVLHVISVHAGHGSVRLLHWEAGQPGGIANDQLRYGLCDHSGSSTLELDAQGGLISQETYYPFGGTSWWAARSAVEATCKTVRYSGKERDASGLYYYGFRYYAPWLQRWINPDPSGTSGGLNLFAMVGNNPVVRVDAAGLAPTELPHELIELASSTAVRLFQSGSALDPSRFKATAQDTQHWMESELVARKKSRTKYANAVWAYARDHFFEGERALAVDRVAMTPDQKEGLHLFWATNAGARYINGATRSVTSHTAPAPATAFSAVRKEVLRELNSNNGETTVKLSYLRREKKLDPAVAMLEKYHGAPAKVARLFVTSLGKPMTGELYRGARVADTSVFVEGAEVMTSGFTSFTPDEDTAKKFMGDKYHDQAFAQGTHPVMFILQGGAKKITSLDEVEGLVEPNRMFTVTDSRREGRHLNVFLQARKSGGRGTWI